MSEHILVSFFSSTKNNKLYIFSTELIHDICYKVKSFLVCKSWNETNHKLSLILCKSKFLLKCNFILPLFFSEGYLVIIVGNSLICLWIIFIIINTINDAGQNVGSCSHKTIKILPIEWRLDLFCICFTNCCNTVCIYNTTFKIVCIIVCFKFIRCKVFIRKTCNIFNLLKIPYSLEFKIMNCHYRLNSLIKFTLWESFLKIYGNETGLPVVAMNYIWSESKNRKCWKCCFAKESKLLNIFVNPTVWLIASKIEFIINKIEYNTIPL